MERILFIRSNVRRTVRLALQELSKPSPRDVVVSRAGEQRDLPETYSFRTVRVSHVQGLHLRPCSAIVSEVRKHRAQVMVRNGGRTANAASIFDLLSLAAPQGTELVLSALGAEAGEALEAVAGLLADDA
ncbi:MAG: HPr family phosphocarrier protein [Planctomycetota bacterium]|nr:HPr family phosphocarrier protein [Planctomycetota bacterium]